MQGMSWKTQSLTWQHRRGCITWWTISFPCHSLPLGCLKSVHTLLTLGPPSPLPMHPVQFLEFEQLGLPEAYCDLVTSEPRQAICPSSSPPSVNSGAEAAFAQQTLRLTWGGSGDTVDIRPLWQVLASCGEVPWWALTLLSGRNSLVHSSHGPALFSGRFLSAHHPVSEHSCWALGRVPSLLASSWYKLKGLEDSLIWGFLNNHSPPPHFLRPGL